MLVPERLVGIFQKVLIYWDLHTHGLKKRQYPVSVDILSENALLRITRLMHADRKKTVTQKTSQYFQERQKPTAGAAPVS